VANALALPLSTTKGVVKVFDIRQTGGAVLELDDIIAGKVPVHSVVPVPPMPMGKPGHTSPGRQAEDRGLAGTYIKASLGAHSHRKTGGFHKPPIKSRFWLIYIGQETTGGL
jgi:hypothetical protein